MVKRKFIISLLCYILSSILFGVYLLCKFAGWYYTVYRIISIILLVVAIFYMLYAVLLFFDKRNKQNDNK